MESGKIAEFDGINKMSKFCERFGFMAEKAFIFDMDGPTLPRKLQKKSQKSEEYQRFSLLFLYSYVIII